jgi:hypothetical protein
MLFACGYFLYIEGLFSYASFVAIEVIVISSLAASLMLLDAISALKCKTSESKYKQDGNKVITGLDYESEDDNEGKRIARKKKWKDMGDELGADE